MPGFYISNLEKGITFKNFDKSNNKFDFLENEEYKICRLTINKFLNDKLFYEDSDCFILIEGVILNKEELIQKYHVSDFINLIKYFLSKKETLYFSQFRGCFAGAFYNKKQKKWTIYTNQVGDRPVFYWYENGFFIFSTDFSYVIEGLKNNSISCNLSKEAVNDMLTYGFMVSGKGENTLVKEIKRLSAGYYIEVEKNLFTRKKYYCFSNKKPLPNHIREDEIVEKIDELFVQAIKREYNKDREYGYKHIASLSGGLDSRMSLWVAYKEGYQDILSVCFSQMDYLDYKISKDIASYLNIEYLFKSLNDSKFLFDLEEIVSKNYGLGLYGATATSSSIFKTIQFSDYGIFHSGQVGDAILGTHCKKAVQEKINYNAGKYSLRLDGNKNADCDIYPNEEMFFLYNRGFRGATASQLFAYHYTEFCSPFLDVDFLNYCLSIPLKFRVNHSIYKTWIIKKYPEAAKFKWEKLNGYITAGNMKLFLYKIKNAGLKRAFFILLNKMGFSIKMKQTLEKGMNPFDKWYKNNPALKEFMDTYFKKNIVFIEDRFLNASMSQLYKNGNTLEKTQVLTVLAFNLLFIENT